MQIHYSDTFKKSFKKLPKKIQTKFYQRLELLVENPSHPLLKVHPLKGNLVGLRAFSITGDYRTIYFLLTKDSIELVDIGTHSQVY